MTLVYQKHQKEERNPWTLWLMKTTVHYSEIPSTIEMKTKLEKAFMTQSENLLKPFVESLIKYLQTINDKVEQARDEIEQDAEKKLRVAHQRNNESMEYVEAYWQPLHERTKEAQNTLSDLVSRGNKI